MRIGSSPQRAVAVEPAAPPPSSVAEAPVRAPQRTVVQPPRERLDSIDLLRGLVMVIMALDHVRDYFSESRFDPLDLSQTTIPLALTRLITHFCAPVFVFLAGTGAYLSLTRGKSRPALSRFLLTRGLWLVFLELTFVRLAWEFNFNYSFAFVQVIWAIGWSMIALSALVYLPSRAVGRVRRRHDSHAQPVRRRESRGTRHIRMALADPPCVRPDRVRTRPGLLRRLSPHTVDRRHGCGVCIRRDIHA